MFSPRIGISYNGSGSPSDKPEWLSIYKSISFHFLSQLKKLVQGFLRSTFPEILLVSFHIAFSYNIFRVNNLNDQRQNFDCHVFTLIGATRLLTYFRVITGFQSDTLASETHTPTQSLLFLGGPESDCTETDGLHCPAFVGTRTNPQDLVTVWHERKEYLSSNFREWKCGCIADKTADYEGLGKKRSAQ